MNLSHLFTSLVIGLLAVPLSAAEPDAASPQIADAEFDAAVKPFLAKHCLECHDAKAKAGYRVDQLSRDFTLATTAEHWKEVLDRVNVGEMPPEEKPRPTADEIAKFTGWINARLREVDERAKNAGGRIPMRRLNRDEYANTIRDLLKLDGNIVRPLLEEMPADGTAEGFDRLGVALFFDQTQIERSLDATSKIAARAIVTEPPKAEKLRQQFVLNPRRPPAEMLEVFPAFTHKIPRGAKDRIQHESELEVIQGGPTYRREWDKWGVIEHFQVRDVVKQDGYYRVRIHATIDDRGRTEPNEFMLIYAQDSPIQVIEKVPYDPSGVTEATLFLRGPVNGEVKGPQVLRVLWNHTHNSVIREPQYMALVSQWTGLRGKIEQAVTRRAPEAELAEMYKQRETLKAKLDAWTGPANVYNPAMDVEKLPRLHIKLIEVEGPVQPAPKTNRYVNKFEGMREKWGRIYNQIPVFPEFAHQIPRGAKDRIAHQDEIEFIQGTVVGVPGMAAWGSVENLNLRNTVTEDGYYRIRIKARAENRGRDVPQVLGLHYALNSSIEVNKDLKIDPSGTTETTMFLRGSVNGEAKGPQILRVWWNHTQDAVVFEPAYGALVTRWQRHRNLQNKAALERAPAAEQAALQKTREEIEKELNGWTGPAFVYNPKYKFEDLPRLFISSIEVEGPIQSVWPPASHKTLFFADEQKTDAAYVREIWARFLPRAYRRPVTPEEIDAITAVVADAQATSKLSFIDAMRVGLQRVLCSPGFVFLEEPTGDRTEPRPLTDYELASRLSYFLWSTMPDEELFALAAAGKLRDPTVATAQVTRMLADPKAEQFVLNFGGQWLSVREYGSIKPAAEYRDYDRALEAASKREPLEFFGEVLRHDLPITSFLDSDFLVVNDRLAKHYGIEGVTGDEFRRVAIEPKHHRGGVLGMTGLMTLLADGTRTLPMRRGSWVLRVLLNDPPNDPPPNAGEIQPNTSGQSLTVRQRLELHRNDDVCASCHAKLDPFGLALENYDAIGAWQERFNGEGFRGGRDAPVLDVSGTFPDGSKFTTLEEYKDGLLAQKDRFARAFSTKLLTYALGRPVGYADHDLLDELVDVLKKNEYRIQPLIHAIAASSAFNAK